MSVKMNNSNLSGSVVKVACLTINGVSKMVYTQAFFIIGLVNFEKVR